MPQPKRTRRSRATTRKMPVVLVLADIETIETWPLGGVKTASSAGEGWTDCIVHLDPKIRLGGRFNSRRVRYDGRFFISYNKRRVYLSGALVFKVLDKVSHVYGVCKENDKEHNKALKGY